MNKTHEERLALAKHFIEVLNTAVACDPSALHKLAEIRVKCNDALAKHPTVQVRTSQVSSSTGAAILITEHRVGLLGILNGLIGVDEHENGYLAGNYSKEDGKLYAFVLNGNLGIKPK